MSRLSPVSPALPDERWNNEISSRQYSIAITPHHFSSDIYAPAGERANHFRQNPHFLLAIFSRLSALDVVHIFHLRRYVPCEYFLRGKYTSTRSVLPDCTSNCCSVECVCFCMYGKEDSASELYDVLNSEDQTCNAQDRRKKHRCMTANLWARSLSTGIPSKPKHDHGT